MRLSVFGGINFLSQVLFPAPGLGIYGRLLARLFMASVSDEKAGTEKRCAFVPDVRGASREILRTILLLLVFFSTLGTFSLEGFACSGVSAAAAEGLDGTRPTSMTLTGSTGRGGVA